VRQVATGSDVVVAPPSARAIEFAAFSPDGDHVLYCRRGAEQSGYRSLYEAPSLGGPERERAFDVDSRVSFSPDGSRMCFSRFDQRLGESHLVLHDEDTGREHVLTTVHGPSAIIGAPAWSPDGRHIAVLEQVLPNYSAVLAVYDTSGAGRREVFRKPGCFFTDVAWLPGGRSLAVTGVDPHVLVGNMVFFVRADDGAMHPLTNDANDYSSVTAANDTAVAVVRSGGIDNIWIADPVSGAARQLTTATTTESSPGALVTENDGSVDYTSTEDQTFGLWCLPATGGAARRVSTGPGWVGLPAIANGQVVYFGFDLHGGGHVFRVASAGGEPQRLTNGHGERPIEISSRGGYVIFGIADSSFGLWIVPAAGGAPRLLSRAVSSSFASASPDGARIAVHEHEPTGNGRTRSVFEVLPASGGPSIARLHPPEASATAEFRLGNDGLYFDDLEDAGHNLARLPLDGGPLVRVTTFHEGIVSAFQISPDGDHIAVKRRIGDRSSVWIVDREGGHPVEIRGIDAPNVFRMVWSPDGRRLGVTAGHESNDAVILRGVH
jgi:Tol biopolymer transport system component